MRSFREYRFEEASVVGDDLAELQRNLIYAVQIQFQALASDLKRRGGSDNPFDIMRQSLPWHRRLRNWWNQTWHGDTSKESSEIGIEFSDDLLVEGELFLELQTILAEGPVNQAITTMLWKLDQTRQKIVDDINSAFSSYRASRTNAAAPTGKPASSTPTPASAGSSGAGVRNAMTPPPPPPSAPPSPSGGPTPPPSAPPSPSFGPAAAAPPPSTSPSSPSDEPEAAVDEPTEDQPGDAPAAEPEVSKPEPQTADVPDSSHVVDDVKLDDYGLVTKAMVGGKFHRVTHAVYGIAGRLKKIQVKGLAGDIDIPDDLGRKWAIHYGRREGSPKEIHDAIARGKPEVSPDPSTLKPQPWAAFVPHNKDKPRRPHNHFDVQEPPPGSERPHEEDDVEDIGDYGEKNYAKTVKDMEDRKKVISDEEKVASWTEQKKEYINPKLFHIINSPPSPEYKETTLSFILSLVPAARLALFGRLSTLLDDTHADLGKLDWVVKMGEAGARKIGRQLSRLRRESDIEDFGREAIQIFQSPESLQAWTEGLSEHSLRIRLGRDSVLKERVSSRAQS